jgi:hypothetical protein
LRIAWILCIVTALLHIVPGLIRQAFLVSHTCAMNNASRASVASATDGISTSQARLKNDFSRLAIAQAQPTSFSRWTILPSCQDNELSKPMTNKVQWRTCHVV